MITLGVMEPIRVYKEGLITSVCNRLGKASSIFIGEFTVLEEMGRNTVVLAEGRIAKCCSGKRTLPSSD
jgi:hypothetical protein